MRIGSRDAAPPSIGIAGRQPRKRLAVLGGALLICAAAFAGATPAAAFLEFLFGGGQAPSPAPTYSVPYSRSPLDISVRPRRGAHGHAERPRHHKRELGRRSAPGRGEARHAVGEQPDGKSRTAGRQRSIDPEKHPDWFLIDPNIRRGDILVLKSGPVVYLGDSHGARTRSREDFVSLGQSRTLSRSGLRDIRMRVSGVWTPPEEGAAAEPAAGKRQRRAHR